MLTQNPDGIKFEESGLSGSLPVKYHNRIFHENTVIRMHYHSSFEINTFINAEGTINVEGNKIPIDRYSLILLNPDTLHSYNIAGNGGEIRVWHIGLKYFSLLNGQNIETLLKEKQQQAILKKTHSSKIENLLDKILTKNKFISTAALLELFNEIAAEGSSEPVKYRGDDFLLKIISFSEKYFRTGITLDKAAEAVNLSRYHFCRKFKDKTDSTYFNYINNLKIENSIICLNNGMSVSGASAESGFEDISYFIKKFRSKYGITPGQYVKSIFPADKASGVSVDLNGLNS